MSADMQKGAVKDPEVNVALDKQQKAICSLEETMKDVWEKFRPVLREEPNGVGLEEKESSSDVPLVAELDRKTKTIRNINSQLRNILGLCEL